MKTREIISKLSDKYYARIMKYPADSEWVKINLDSCIADALTEAYNLCSDYMLDLKIAESSAILLEKAHKSMPPD